MKPVLIIGGTGVFGKRLARHLSDWDGIEVMVSSRDASKAAAFARSLSGSVSGVGLDTGNGLVARLQELRPFAVVDCSGPFQGAGYDTARAVVEAGAHFIDLADARDYLAGFEPALDGPARKADVAALTGASSTPALSASVVAELTQGWRQVENIDISITPGGRSEVGQSVIAAILSYAGHTIPVWEDGRLGETTGWRDGRSVHIPQLGTRRVAAVETYDAEYLGSRHGVSGDVRFFAGLESRLEQFGIETIAALRARGLLPDMRRLIPMLLALRKITRIPTSDRGGMLVEVAGIDGDGVAQKARWSLIARNDHGPFIPILPAAAALRVLMEEPIRGAAIADTRLSLKRILHEMAPYDIETDRVVTPSAVSA